MKKVIIVGGGFAGSQAAKKLENKFDVTLIDTKDYFEFTPGILRTLVEHEHLPSLHIRHSKYLKKTTLITAIVTKITENNVIANGKKYYFDYLLICSGSSYASPMKRQDVVMPSRVDELLAAHKKVRNAENVLVIGGGPVGVELASEICMKYKNKPIVLVHARDVLLERNKKRTQNYITKFLKKKGVRIIYGEKVIKESKGIFVTDKGTKIKADIAFMCVGIRPNTSFMTSEMNKYLDDRKYIKVNNQMQVTNNIFAVGDANNVAVEKTAQNAADQTSIAVKNILAMENKTKLQSYKARKTPLCINLGRWNGVLETDSFVLTGLIPGILKHIIELKEMLMLRYF